MRRRLSLAIAALSFLSAASWSLTACSVSNAARREVLLNRGSDTMINIAMAWAEAYARVDPGVSVEVAGGGSGVGIAALTDGTVDIANSSRPLKPGEVAQARRTGGAPREFIVGYDALAVYVHRSNPLESLTLSQLADIFAEGGPAARWSDLGVANAACRGDRIVRVSRQSSSGTYEFFRAIALGGRDFKLGTLELNGSKEVVELVSNTPCAIGYSGMGYATDGVRMVPLAKARSGRAIPPSVVTTLDRSYPIARPLYMFVLGDRDGAVARYLAWIRSDEGQRIVAKVGYVPLRPGEGS
jgi:phosphate transport system substrate-binding protein